MWQDQLQDAVASNPWLEPHQDVNRNAQAPGMQLADWYGFSVPKTGKRMFLKQSARNDDLLVVGEVDNIYSFFDDSELQFNSNILFDDLDEALDYCETIRSGFISDTQLHSNFIMYEEPGFSAMPGGGFAGWRDIFNAARGNLEYANKLLLDCQGGDRDGMDPRRCAREDLIDGAVVEFGSEYIMTGDSGRHGRMSGAEILRRELDRVPTDGDGHIAGYFHGFPLGTSLDEINSAIDEACEVDNDSPNKINVPEELELPGADEIASGLGEKPTVSKIEADLIREAEDHPTRPEKPVWTNLEVPCDNVKLVTGVSRKTDRQWYRADCTLGDESSIKPDGKFRIWLSERQYARAEFQKNSGIPVRLGLKTANYPDGIEIDGEMVELEDLVSDINAQNSGNIKDTPALKEPEKQHATTKEPLNGNEWVNFRFFHDQVRLSKAIDPDTAKVDYRAIVHSEIDGRGCSFTLHLAKWQYDKAVRAQNQRAPVHIGMQLKYIKNGSIDVSFCNDSSCRRYSPKELEASLPEVQRMQGTNGRGGNRSVRHRASDYQTRSYQFKTEEAHGAQLPQANENRG